MTCNRFAGLQHCKTYIHAWWDPHLHITLSVVRSSRLSAMVYNSQKTWTKDVTILVDY